MGKKVYRYDSEGKVDVARILHRLKKLTDVRTLYLRTRRLCTNNYSANASPVGSAKAVVSLRSAELSV